LAEALLIKLRLPEFQPVIQHLFHCHLAFARSLNAEFSEIAP
jgi:hypothetical protein